MGPGVGYGEGMGELWVGYGDGMVWVGYGMVFLSFSFLLMDGIWVSYEWL